MTFSVFTNYLQQVEQTASRNEMTELLAKMLDEASADEIDKIVYLSLGNVGPLYDELEFGLSNKLMYRAVGQAFDLDADEVKSRYKELGDLGDLVEELKLTRSRDAIEVVEVFSCLREIAKESGEGSQDRKLQKVAALISDLDARSAKYATRIPLGKLRLGFSSVTILDALSWMQTGDKSLRGRLERAYNVAADIGKVAQRLKVEGIKGVDKITMEVGIPIRPAAAERLPTAEKIIEKLGRVAAEPKIDGFRLQCHYEKDSRFEIRNSKKGGEAEIRESSVQIYSRNLEDMTHMFPEIEEAIQALDVDSIIFEGEAVAYVSETEEFLPFQETIQRRRKYNVAEKAEEIPLTLFVFDLLYLNGENYLTKPQQKRRKKLEKIFANHKDTLRLAEEKIFDNAEELGEFFLEQVGHGLEGIMVKRLDAEYAAGARNNNWVKLKREEKGELDDTIDCLVMGYKMGTGKRAEFGIGAFLVGVYDKREDMFKTLSNVGTGLTDEQWRKMKERADALETDHKPARYDVPKELEQDVWIQPEMVVEILADEITRSPLHTAGKVGDKPGYALRFPRLISWRDDKNAEQATTVKEVKNLHKLQRA